MKKRLLAILLTFTMTLGITASALGYITTPTSTNLNKTVSDISNSVIKANPNPGPQEASDWFVLGISKSNISKSSSTRLWYKTYVKNLKANLQNLNSATDYAKIIIALNAIGENPENFYGINLITEMERELNDLGYDDIYTYAYVLIALNTKGYTLSQVKSSDFTNESLVSKIISLQYTKNDDKKGSYGYNNWDKPYNYIDSIDSTAIIIQALAPYYDTSLTNKDVCNCINLALNYLKSKQDPNGGFASKEDNNGEFYVDASSTAQVFLALIEIGIDPLDEANGFIKEDNNIYTALMSVYNHSTKNFKTFLYEDPNNWNLVTGFGDNKFATEQSLYTLVAYSRFLEHGKSSLFDMNDIKDSLVAPDITSIKLNKSSVTITGIKKTAKVTIKKITPSNAAKWYKWSSSNKKIAKVNSSGTITAVSPGSATIKLTSYDNTQGGKIVSASVKTKIKLAKPTYPKAKAGKKKITIYFKKVIGAKKYEIYKKNSKGKWKKLKTIKKTKFVDKKVKKGKKYSYKVKAVNGKNKSAATKTFKSKRVK